MPTPAYSIKTRMLAEAKPVGRVHPPALELISAEPSGERRGAPLLFVHGAFGAAWMWAEHFIPYFVRRGRRCTAVSLRGHGGSEGRPNLADASLADYIADVMRALDTLTEPPVLVGHSLGGLIAQRLVGTARIRGLVLIASVPPEGLALVGGRLAAGDPVVWLDAFIRSVAGFGFSTTEAARRALFSPDAPVERIRRFAALMNPESPRALSEAHIPVPMFSTFLTGVPSLVIAAGEDRVVSRAASLRTAFFQAAQYRLIEGLGHAAMLDVGWEHAARTMLDWLEARDI